MLNNRVQKIWQYYRLENAKTGPIRNSIQITVNNKKNRHIHFGLFERTDNLTETCLYVDGDNVRSPGVVEGVRVPRHQHVPIFLLFLSKQTCSEREITGKV